MKVGMLKAVNVKEIRNVKTVTLKKKTGKVKRHTHTNWRNWIEGKDFKISKMENNSINII
jgi:hypothetical protein